MRRALLDTASVPTLGGLALVLQTSPVPVMTVGSLDLRSFNPITRTAVATDGQIYRIEPVRADPRPTRLPGLGG